MSVERHGFEILRHAFEAAQLDLLHEHLSELSLERGAPGVRDICGKSAALRRFAQECGARFAPGRRCVRSILFDKTPSGNWPVAWHQDLTIALRERRDTEGYGPWSVKDGVPCVQPPIEVLAEMRSVRVHLDDAPAENGALEVVPGSHRLGRISPGDVPRHTGDKVVCECQAGDVLVMAPLILHASKRSKNASRRRVLHLEFASEDSLAPGLEWHRLD